MSAFFGRILLETPVAGAWAVCDARFDRRALLLRELGLPDASGDEAMLLAAYARWGEGMPSHLQGDFAFALWDPDGRRLLCARDPFGIRPLFLKHDPGRGLAFASSLKPLLELPGASRAMTARAVADHLLMLRDDPEAAPYPGLARLSPGGALSFSPAGLRTWRWWSPGGPDPEDLADPVHAFRRRLEASVSERIRSPGKPGAMLSGGLDSSSVARLAADRLQEEGRGPLPVYAAVFPDAPGSDTRPEIAQVLAGGGMAPVFLEPDRHSPLEAMDRVCVLLDAPLSNAQATMDLLILEAARRDGTDVLLTGYGSEETQGQRLLCLLTDLARAGRWEDWISELRFPARLWSHVLRPRIPEPARRAWRSLRGNPVHPALRFLRPAFVRSLGLDERLRRRDAVPAGSREDQRARLDDPALAFSYESSHLLGAAQGIAFAHPFHDADLTALGLAVPSWERLRGGRDRFLLRRAMAGRLPDAVRLGPKKDLEARLVRALLRHERPLLEEAFTERGLEPLSPYVDVPVLLGMARAFLGKAAAGIRMEEEEIAPVWQSLTLLLWIRRGGSTMPA